MEHQINQMILGDGNYRLNTTIVYHSKRYGKTVTVDAGEVSDGATGAFDVVSRAWWVHDQLCNTGEWDDGTKITNWQCSQVLQDILTEEGRKGQGRRWFWATFLFGGGKARKNGLFNLSAMLGILLLSGCALTDNLATYDATISTPTGGQYAVHNKHGSLLVLETEDMKITADDRGHPQEQGMLGKLVEYATVKAASDID